MRQATKYKCEKCGHWILEHERVVQVQLLNIFDAPDLIRIYAHLDCLSQPELES